VWDGGRREGNVARGLTTPSGGSGTVTRSATREKGGAVMPSRTIPRKSRRRRCTGPLYAIHQFATDSHPCPISTSASGREACSPPMSGLGPPPTVVPYHKRPGVGVQALRSAQRMLCHWPSQDWVLSPKPGSSARKCNNQCGLD